MDKKPEDKIEYTLDEIISPIFGDDYKNRIFIKKTEKPEIDNINSNIDSNIDRHIEKDLLQKNKLDKNKEYQTKVENNVDVLKQYQQDKTKKEIMESLPSNYLNFRDNLERNTIDLTMINNNEQDDNTMSQIINDIFDKENEEY